MGKLEEKHNFLVEKKTFLGAMNKMNMLQELRYLNPYYKLMNSFIWFDTLDLGWFIEHTKGSKVRIYKLECTQVPGDFFYLTK